jgi:hypothetical protein
MNKGLGLFALAVLLILLSMCPASAVLVDIPAYKYGTLQYYTSSGADWSAIHDATSATTLSASADASCDVAAYTVSNKFVEIDRGYIIFNTSAVAEDDYVSSAQILMKFSLKKEELGVITIDIVNFTPDDPTAPVKDDFNNFGDIIYANYFSNQVTAGGTGYYISIDPDQVVPGGLTKIGFRTDWDVSNSPPTWLSNKQSILSIDDSGAGTTTMVLRLNITAPPPTVTPTPYPGTISVNILEKYSNAALINQAITLTPTAGGAGETKTSLYGETLHFGVVPGMEYWFNASRAGYQDYNETYTIPDSPGIYNVYMERILTPIANHSYAHFSVVDQTNGGLIPNAEIRLSDGQTKLTNSAGYAWFSVNNSEQINYYVSKPSGYWPAYGAMNLTADESILVALQRYTGPTATQTLPGWTPVTVPTTGTGVNPVVTLSAQLRQQNVQEGMDVWYTNLPFISQFLFLLFIIGGLGLMAGGTRRN